MSASPVARQATNCQFIPSRRVVLNDPSQLPIDYSSTPGGTLYSTTPGGTRIVYERSFLLNLRNSPIARTPPKNLNSFPNELVTSPTKAAAPAAVTKPVALAPPAQGTGKVVPTIDETSEQFEMDI